MFKLLFGPQCQSCGMPLKKDEQGGGSEKDGSISKTYCSRCYGKGKFLQPNINVDQMCDLVETKMKEMGMPGFISKMMTKQISSLKRWR